MEVSGFEKDVVTDFATYGLAQPLREVSLRTVVTNAAGVTNILLSQVDFGTNAAGILFARRWDETSVYAFEESDYLRLPAFGWQMRDRRVWNFAITNVLRATVSQGGRANQFIRHGTNDWSFGPTAQGIVNKVALEEAVLRLGELTAVYWLDRGEPARARHGFSAESHRVEIEVKEGDNLQSFILEFGPPRGAPPPLACVTLDGQPWVFEFPRQLYQMIVREIPLPKPPPASGQ
jgi:hypothetical protein